MNKSFEKVVKQLNNLPDEKSIVKFLEDNKIKGYPGNTCACPIAKFLRSVGFENASSDGFLVYSSHINRITVRLEQHVQLFINNFDDGKYPQLIEQ